LALILLLILLVPGFDVLNAETQGQRRIGLPVPQRPDGCRKALALGVAEFRRNNGTQVDELAAERRKNAAHGASRG